MRVLPCPSAFRLVLGLLALLIMAPAWADDPVAEYNAIKRASLKGIESVEVVVLAARSDSECRQLSAEQLETATEAQLHEAGIPLGPGAASYLFVSVTSVEALTNLLCGFAVSVDLQQVVVLVRDMRITTFGTTWHQGGLGVAAIEKHPEYLRRMLAALVDEFITAYLEQNPKP